MQILFIILFLFLGCDNDPSSPTDCTGSNDGTAFINDCGLCVGGTTDNNESLGKDCNDVCFGQSLIDDCGECVVLIEYNVSCFGCMDENASNYDPVATVDGDCMYATLPDEIYEYEVDDFPFVTVYNENTNIAMMKFYYPINLNQFNIEYWHDDLTYECEENENCVIQADTTNLYKISNSQVFGVDCSLIYDSNYNTLTGYDITTPIYPEGTGESCNPLYLEGLQLPEGNPIYESIDLIAPEENMTVYPNPFTISLNEDSQNGIYFSYLSYGDYISIYNGNRLIIQSLDYNDDDGNGNTFYDLTDLNGNSIDSGIYFYEIRNNNYEDGEIGTHDPLIYQGSFTVLMSND